MIDLTVKTSGGTQTLEVREMPPEIFEWQRQARIKNLEAIMNDGMFEGFGPHLPTMSVLNAEGDFPVNSAAKGVGLIPKPEYMESYLAKFNQLVEEAVIAGWKSSMTMRVQALLDFYQKPDHIDRTALGSLELYARRTYAGVRKDPRASLLFVDLAEGNLSYEMHVASAHRTPERVARMYEELLAGYKMDPVTLVNGALFSSDYKNMVVVRDIEFYSLCEHHMLPFTGKAHVAYIPDGKIIGLSKIPRFVEMYARRLQVQERMTQQIAGALDDIVRPNGVAVVVEGTHLCAVMRGVKKSEASMVTSTMSGAFEREESLRKEFFDQLSRP